MIPKSSQKFNNGDDDEEEDTMKVRQSWTKNENLETYMHIFGEDVCVKPPDWEEGDTFIIHNIQRKWIEYFCYNTQVRFNKVETLFANLKSPWASVHFTSSNT